MNKKMKQELVPELRFPEFLDAGNWEFEPLKKVCEVNPSSGALPESFVYIDLESVKSGELLQKKVIMRDGAPSRAQRLLETEDIIFQMVRPYQKNNYFFKPDDNMQYVASTGYAQLRANESKMYLYQCLGNDRFVERVLAKCTGSNYPAINSNDLSRIKVEIPKGKEQQKIADCLSSLDELIAAHTQKYEALQSFKKGLMQNLFPAEGETVPALRFPEFRDAAKWNVSTIDDIASVSSGGTPSRSEPSYWGGEIPWVSTTLIDFNKVESVNEFITEPGLNNSSAKLFPKGTILMAMYGQGKTRGKVGILGIEAAINQACAAISLKKCMNGVFVFQNLAARYDEIRNISNQGGQENLSGALIKTIPLAYPEIGSGEQELIADCLSSVDDLINVQAQKIEELKAHKKGLMQQLFPAMDEVGA